MSKRVSIKFYLIPQVRSSRQTSDALYSIITGSVSYRGIRLMFSTGFGCSSYSIDGVTTSDFWNKDKQRFYIADDFLKMGITKSKFEKGMALKQKGAHIYTWNDIVEEMPKINSALDTLHSTLMNNLNKFIDYSETITREGLRSELNEIVFSILGKNVVKEDEKKTDISVISALERFVEETKSGQRLHNGRRLTHSTYKTYVTLQNHLILLNKSYKLTFSSLTNDSFLPALQKYAEKIFLSDVYLKTLIKITKTFLVWCQEQKIIDEVNYKNFRMHVRTNDQDKIALTETQLAMIENADLDIVFPDKKKSEITKEVQSYRANLKRTRDLFLLQCYTGLRFSDACRIKAGNIYLNNPIPIIKIQTQKTGHELILPIGKKLLEILKRHDKPEGFCNRSGQKYNEALHELARVCELTEQIEVVSFVGGKEQRSQKSLDKLISSHTGRRTFITIALMRGKSPSVIMQFSGHKTLSSFQKYIRIAEQQALQEMSDIF